MTTREYEIVLFGATGFTGKLVAEYLAGRVGRSISWAIAGRSEAKLLAVRSDLAKIDPALEDLAIEIADGHDVVSLDRLVPKARVICTTVGPYTRHGALLASAAARHGTHYCDLTGEVPFVRRSIDENDARARATGARIVHCSGFDSIPFDLAVFMLWSEGAKRAPLASAKCFVTKLRGGFSGGTAASMLTLLDEAAADREILRLLANPRALDPDPSGRHPEEADQRGVVFDADVGWTAPFVMSAINMRVVRRTNALLGHGYGPGFQYREAMAFRRGPGALLRASVATAGLGTVVLGGRFRWFRRLVERLGPKPGTGPSPDARAQGHFEVRAFATTEAGEELSGRVVGHHDPGYGETSIMLGEAALCLAQDPPSPGSVPAGVLTPASAMGTALLARLRRAGMEFVVLEKR